MNNQMRFHGRHTIPEVGVTIRGPSLTVRSMFGASLMFVMDNIDYIVSVIHGLVPEVIAW